MSSFKSIAGKALLVIVPVAFLVIETGGKSIP